MNSETNPEIHGVVGVVTHQCKWLVIRRSEHVRAPGKFCFPGGGIEAGESEAEALVREFQEELRVRVQPAQFLWRSRTSWGVHLAWWHAELLDDHTAIEPNPAEVAEVHWLAPHDIKQLTDLLPSNHEFLDAWRSQRFNLPGQYDLDGLASAADRQRRGIVGKVGTDGDDDDPGDGVVDEGTVDDGTADGDDDLGGPLG